MEAPTAPEYTTSCIVSITTEKWFVKTIPVDMPSGASMIWRIWWYG
jgi:hypothetical protein